MGIQVYLLEDDKSICDLVKCALEMANISIACFYNVESFMKAFENEQPKVALLDIMLPDGNGIEVLKTVKNANPKVYCIMLSALSQETDKVKGLNAGADDYISKPFGVLELTARVNVALRKTITKTLRVGDIVMYEDSMLVYLKDEKLDLNNKEFQLLRYFMLNVGKVLSREQILTTVWGYSEGETRTVDNHVARLRKSGIDYFETVFGVGYKFEVKR